MESGREREIEDPDVLRQEEEEEPEDLERKTEQGDELGKTQSVEQQEDRGKEPYRPPRQPTLEQPDDEREKPGSED